MRRRDREIIELSKMLEIMEKCDCCRVGFVDGNEAYIVPLNFGFEESDRGIVLYFHSAKEGRKINLLNEVKTATFEMDSKHELVEGKIACDFSYLYQCIMGKGKVELVTDNDEKVHGLTKIMSHYSKVPKWEFKQEHVDRVAVFKITVTEWSCKEH